MDRFANSTFIAKPAPAAILRCSCYGLSTAQRKSDQTGRWISVHEDLVTIGALEADLRLHRTIRTPDHIWMAS
jgi:hypothetical protein